ncbi:ubiquinol-cytochrome-c reductase complex subunit-domain-containing protein [Trametes elegans]|nr:ubiquinol-cytochrome-c reductase complex subunit-domain-containing protein [Trametes elegans]
MSRVIYHSVPPQTVVQRFARTWAPSATLWGAGAGVAALYLLSVTPLVKREFLSKVPVLGGYFQDKTPASDKPF